MPNHMENLEVKKCTKRLVSWFETSKLIDWGTKFAPNQWDRVP